MGMIVSLVGAMLMTFCKGPVVNMLWSPHHQSPKDQQASTPAAPGTDNKDWIVGSVLMIAATLAWSVLFILQVVIYFSHIYLFVEIGLQIFFYL